MTFWLLLSGCLALAFVAIGLGLDRVQDARPKGVSPADWQRVAEERERERLTRVMGLKR